MWHLHVDNKKTEYETSLGAVSSETPHTGTTERSPVGLFLVEGDVTFQIKQYIAHYVNRHRVLPPSVLLAILNLQGRHRRTTGKKKKHLILIAH